MNAFSRRRILLLTVLTLLLASTYPAVSVGADSGGITIHSGGLDMAGNDIVDGGTTIWDSSTGQVPESAYNPSGLIWTDLGISKSDVSAGDVGLGNVQNEAQVSETGDTITGQLIVNTTDTSPNPAVGILAASSDDGTYNFWIDSNGAVHTQNSLHFEDTDGGSDDMIQGITTIQSDNYNSELSWVSQGSGITGGGDSEQDFTVKSKDSVIFQADTNSDQGGSYACAIEGDNGNWNCDGTKNWIHNLNSTHEAYYTSQESPQVRAVNEGKTHVDGPTNITLPNHFEKTVSDSQPLLRVQATPQGAVAAVGVLQKTDSWIILDASKEVNINYRITGIRAGYEDKQVVRPKSAE